MARWASRLHRDSARLLAVWVFVFAFGLFAGTQGPRLVGYEPESAAVAEGVARTGDFVVLDDSPLRQRQGVAGKDGKQVGRAGLPQALFEVPFYSAGAALDGVSEGGDDSFWRRWTVLFYNPFVGALGCALFFLIALRLTGSRGWAVTLAGLFALGSLAWPYAKMGMETTLTLGMLLTFFGALKARDTKQVSAYALAGIGAGIAVAAKPYAFPAVVAVMLLLLPLKPPRPKAIAAAAVPFALWIVAMLWFNWVRTGSITTTGNTEYEVALSAPFNLVGYFFSPGKGLIFYSPLVVLGALGLAGLWRADRRFAQALLLALGLTTLAVGITPFGGEETWGPRYLVPVAWLLLLPIPWFATTKRRRQALGAVAVVAVAVQVVAVAAPYDHIMKTAPPVVGSKVYNYQPGGFPYIVPLGDDTVRWIPQLSPIVIQGAMVTSRFGEAVGAPPITYAYRPHRGIARKVTFEGDRTTRFDVWWREGGARRLLAPLLILSALLAAAVLVSSVRPARA